MPRTLAAFPILRSKIPLSTIQRSAILPSTILLSTILLAPVTAQADKAMTLEARLAQPVMKAGGKHQNYLRVALNGCKPERTDRMPVNVAFVIDRSGSMQGERIAQARTAAMMAVRRLDANDVASVVVFDNVVDVLVPAQPVADHATFTDRIRQIGVRGSTAIHDGVTEGARQVQAHKDQRRLNRVVLLSDGLANVGPSRPEHFARLGRDLLAQGISVSTIGLGLGYNEDLMLQLARASDGNHAFASTPPDLIRIFNREFDDVLSSCAQTVSIDVELRPGARVVRALSRDGEIAGERAKFLLNQVYQATEHYVLLEVELDEAAAAGEQDFGRVRVAYTAPDSGAPQTMETAIRGRFTRSEAEVTAGADSTVMESVIEQTTRERAQQAVALRDAGKSEEARKLLQDNVSAIQSFLAKAPKPSPALQALQRHYESYSSAASAAAPPGKWKEQRKLLRQLDAVGAGIGARY